MARQRMVTRTIVTREVNFKRFNMETMAVEEDKLVFGVGTVIENNTDGIATINKKLHEMGVHATCVMIDSITDNQTLYGMTEDDFIRMAKVLPPRTETEEE